VGVAVHQADRGDTETIDETLQVAEENLRGVRGAGTEEREDDDNDGNVASGDALSGEATTAERAVVADKGYNKAVLLRQLKEKGYRTYIPERRQAGKRRWMDKGGRKTAIAFYGNRARVTRKKGRGFQRKRGELLERTFAHICETGGARRTRLRGRENVSKRYLLQAGAANLGLVMRRLFGRGTPRGLAETRRVCTQAIARLTPPPAPMVVRLRSLFRSFGRIRAPLRVAGLTRAFANAQ
jgi:transposase